MTLELDREAALRLLAAVPCGVVVFDETSHILWYNGTLARLLGVEETAAETQGAAALPQEDIRHLTRVVDGIVFLPETAGHEARWLHCVPQNGLPAVPGARVLYYTDVTEQLRLETEQQRLLEELEQQVMRDPVTGLPNQRSLLLSLDPLVSRSRRYNNALSVVRLRLVGLDEIDQGHGPTSSERTLLAVSQLVKDQTRWADLLGRYTKDELLLILPETPHHAAEALARKLLDGIATLRVIGKDERPVNVSVEAGTASWQKGDGPDAMIERARPTRADSATNAERLPQRPWAEPLP